MIQTGKLLAWLGVCIAIGTHDNIYMAVMGGVCALIYVFLEESDEQLR